jgi:hypothetical protein
VRSYNKSIVKLDHAQAHRVLRLTADYLFRQVDTDESQDIRNRVTKLSNIEALYFYRYSSAMQRELFKGYDERRNLSIAPTRSMNANYALTLKAIESVVSADSQLDFVPASTDGDAQTTQMLGAALFTVTEGKSYVDSHEDLALKWQEALVAFAQNKQLSVFELDTSDESLQSEIYSSARSSSREAVTQQACWWGQVTCTISTQWNGSTRRGICYPWQTVCKAADGHDRVSNQSCEWGDCDYRLYFATPTGTWNGIESYTAAGDCVADDTASRFYSAPYVYTLHGYGRVSSCGINSGWYLTAIMYLAP